MKMEKPTKDIPRHQLSAWSWLAKSDINVKEWNGVVGVSK